MKANKQSLAALKAANKECKTISGVCKIIRAMWRDGYKEAFAQFGLTYAHFEHAPNILDYLQKNAEQRVYITTRKALKDTDGKFVIRDGKRVYTEVEEEVSSWTPAKLWRILDQSLI